MTGKANGAKFQWSLIKVRWHWAGPSLGWSPLGLVAHIKKTQNFLIFIRFEKSLLNVRSYMKEGGVLYLTWFYSMKIIRQGSSSSSFPGYDGHDATSSLLHPPAFLKHHIPEGHLLPWFVNSFCPNSIPAEPCYPCIWPLPVGPGHLGLLQPASCSLLCGWLTCKSPSLIRTVISPRAGSTSHFLYPQCQPNA